MAGPRPDAAKKVKDLASKFEPQVSKVHKLAAKFEGPTGNASFKQPAATATVLAQGAKYSRAVSDLSKLHNTESKNSNTPTSSVKAPLTPGRVVPQEKPTETPSLVRGAITPGRKGAGTLAKAWVERHSGPEDQSRPATSSGTADSLSKPSSGARPNTAARTKAPASAASRAPSSTSLFRVPQVSKTHLQKGAMTLDPLTAGIHVAGGEAPPTKAVDADVVSMMVQEALDESEVHVEGLEGLTIEEVQQLFEALEAGGGVTPLRTTGVEAAALKGEVLNPVTADAAVEVPDTASADLAVEILDSASADVALESESGSEAEGEGDADPVPAPGKEVEKSKTSPDSKPELAPKDNCGFVPISELSVEEHIADESIVESKNVAKDEGSSVIEKKKATSWSLGINGSLLGTLPSDDPSQVAADLAAKKAELAQLDIEVEKRRGDLSKLRVSVATSTSEKVQVESSLRRMKQEFRDWSETIGDESTWKPQEPAVDAGTETADHSEKLLGKAAELGATVMKAKLQRARDEMLVLRKREASVQQDVEYLESKYAQERKENLELKRKLSEMKMGRRDAEREIARLRPEVVALRKAMVALQKRVSTEEEDASLLRKQLQKAQTAEIELLEQVQLANRESSALRKALLWAKEAREESGDWDKELQSQLAEQLQRNADLENKCTEQARAIVQLEMRVGEEGRKRSEAMRALGKFETNATQTGAGEKEGLSADEGSEDASSDGAGAGKELSQLPKTLSMEGMGSLSLGAGIPERVWNLLEQVDAAKTAGMQEKDELVRLHWLTNCLRDELQKLQFATTRSASSQSLSSALPKLAHTVSSTSSVMSKDDDFAYNRGNASNGGSSPPKIPVVGAPPPIRSAAKLAHRSLSNVIRLPTSASKRAGTGFSTPLHVSGDLGLSVEIPAGAPVESARDTPGSAPVHSLFKGAASEQAPLQPPTPGSATAAGGVFEPSSPGARGRLTRWLSKPANRSGSTENLADAATKTPGPARRSGSLKNFGLKIK